MLHVVSTQSSMTIGVELGLLEWVLGSTCSSPSLLAFVPLPEFPLVVVVKPSYFRCPYLLLVSVSVVTVSKYLGVLVQPPRGLPLGRASCYSCSSLCLTTCSNIDLVRLAIVYFEEEHSAELICIYLLHWVVL